MHPNTHRTQRRVHGAEIKSQVLAQCREPGASVAAVAQAHGLNANLVRKWLSGRGLKRTGLAVRDAVSDKVAEVVRPAQAPAPLTASAAPGLQFVALGLPVPSQGTKGVPCEVAPMNGAHIHVELRGANASLVVHWPASQAQGCAAWLSDLAGTVRKA
jgi:transposase